MTEYQDVCISAIEVLYYNSSKKYLLDVSSHMAGWKGVYAFRVVIIIGVSLMYHNQTNILYNSYPYISTYSTCMP